MGLIPVLAKLMFEAFMCEGFEEGLFHGYGAGPRRARCSTPSSSHFSLPIATGAQEHCPTATVLLPLSFCYA